jgi:hypothetical protein
VTIVRGAVLLLIAASIALCAVYLRTEQTRAAAHVQRLEEERIRLWQKSWTLQMEIARLKAPERITDRVERLRLQVAAPYVDPLGRQDAGLANRE